ncbi:MAG: hydrogenase [Clostridiales Family XIII bacterium]|jgi:nitrogenase molybdenum-iron protein beta chain|nr:hydrogenase [Clostridiales Family XIII bacterium]
MSGIIEQPRFSCALAAQQTVLAIPRALPISHSGPGCVGKTFAFSATGAGFQGEGYGGGSTVSCTNSNEQDVVFGGEDKLAGFIDGAMKVLKGDLYVALSGCTSGIVGDDVEQVSRTFAADGFPVVGAETSGFKGNSYVGHEIVLRAIIEQFVGDIDPQVRHGLVNVFSVVPPQHPTWRGDLEEIKRLLTLLGFEVNILFGKGSAGISEWKDIPNAQFNLLLSSWVGLDTVRLLEEKYGTPYLHLPYMPIGAALTSKALREISAFAGLDSEKTEEIIAKEEAHFYDYFVSCADFIADFRNSIPFELYIVADSSYALGAAAYLSGELGFVPEGIYITDDADPLLHQDIKAAADALIPASAREGSANESEEMILFDSDGGMVQRNIRKRLGQSKKALFLASTWEDFLAKETGNLSVHFSLPINNDVLITRSFAGYNGGLRLMEEILAGIFRKGDISGTTLTR